MPTTKILFVCAGNICRSPLAHAIFEKIVNDKGLENKFEIESCGTGAWHVGSLPDSRMISEAQKHDVTMDHPARRLQVMDFEYYDIILAMDCSNLNYLKAIAEPEYQDKIELFRNYDPKKDEELAEVPDPYYGGEAGFANVYAIVERTCHNLLQQLT